MVEEVPIEEYLLVRSDTRESDPALRYRRVVSDKYVSERDLVVPKREERVDFALAAAAAADLVVADS